MFRLATGLLIVLCCGIAPAAEPLPYAEAYQEFQQGERPLLVLLTSKVCRPCTQFKDGTFLPAVREGRTNRVIVTVVERETNKVVWESIRRDSGISRVPSLILFRKLGTRIVKEEPTDADFEYLIQEVPRI